MRSVDTYFDINRFDIIYVVKKIDINLNIKHHFPIMNSAQSIRSPQDLGLVIAKARKSRGLSQRALAAEFGATQAWISRVEQGYQKTVLGQVLRLAVFLGVDLVASSGDVDSGLVLRESSSDYPDLNDLL